VLELVATVSEVSDRGRLQEAEFLPQRPGEVTRSCLEVSRAKRELGWEADVELAAGLRRILRTL
jgi:UDP-glucose 4-epimerase